MKIVTYDILIPKISDEIVDCQVARWLKNVGDFVSDGEIIVELETEKTTIEIESPTEGVLECIYVFEGEEVIDGERIGIINSVGIPEDDEIIENDDESIISSGLDFPDDFDEDEDEFDDEDFDDSSLQKPVYHIDYDDEEYD